MKRFESTMQKEMTRREFLAALGLGIVSLFGMGAIVRLFFGKSDSAHHAVPNSYGSRPYGR